MYQCISQLRWREGQDFPVARSLEDMKKEDPEVFGDPGGSSRFGVIFCEEFSMLFCYIENGGVFIYRKRFSETKWHRPYFGVPSDALWPEVATAFHHTSQLGHGRTGNPETGAVGLGVRSNGIWNGMCNLKKKHCLWVNQISRYMSCFL